MLIDPIMNALPYMNAHEQEWLASDGIDLIEQAAHQEGWRSRLHDRSMWAAMHVYGAYLRWFKR